MGDQKKLYKVQIQPLTIEVPHDIPKSELKAYLHYILKYSGEELVIENYKEIKIANNGENHGS